MRTLLLALTLLLTPALRAQADFGFLEPDIAGYITAISDDSFTVLGNTIHLAPKAKLFTELRGKDTRVDHLPTLHLGQIVGIWGSVNSHSHLISASKVIVLLPPVAHKISGGGIIQTLTSSPTLTVRADGFLLHLSPATRFASNSPITTLNAVSTNQWIEYKGIQLPDSTIDVTDARITSNQLDADEQQRRADEEFTPAAAGTKPGSQPQLLPLHDDPALQARVDRVGASLIPAYQRALPATDPTKINFRFFVVDPGKSASATNFDNGILLVSAPAAARLTDDSQLAELLATGIASTLEEQETPARPSFLSTKTLLYVGAGTALGVLGAPVAGASFASGALYEPPITRAQEQSDRESLWLLHDAGYDLDQAPHTWWTLFAKPKEDPTKVPETIRTDDLYKYLGLSWFPTR